MNGPFYLLILAGMIFLLWKYSGHAKKAIAGVGKVTNGLKNGAASFKNISMILFCVALLLFWWFYSSSWKSPSLAEVVEWKSTYWLPILVGLAIVYALAGYATTVTEVARAIVLAVAFMLFIGFPVWVWATGPSTAPVLSMAPGGKSELVAVPSGMRVVMHGEDIRYHCMYQDGHEESFIKGEPACKDGHVPFVYATNLRTDKGNAVTYSYKKK